MLFFVCFFPSFIAQGIPQSEEAFNHLAYHAQLIIISLSQIWLIFYIITLQNESLMTFGVLTFQGKFIIQGLFVVCGIFLLFIPINIITMLLPEGIRNSIQGNFQWKFENPYLIPMVFISSIITGYREELFFRAYVLTRFEQLGIPFAVSALVGTLFFSAGHLYQGIMGFLVAFLIGLFLAIVFHKYKNLHSIAIGHGLYNAVSLLFSLTQK